MWPTGPPPRTCGVLWAIWIVGITDGMERTAGFLQVCCYLLAFCGLRRNAVATRRPADLSLLTGGLTLTAPFQPSSTRDRPPPTVVAPPFLLSVSGRFYNTASPYFIIQHFNPFPEH